MTRVRLMVCLQTHHSSKMLQHFFLLLGLHCLTTAEKGKNMFFAHLIPNRRPMPLHHSPTQPSLGVPQHMSPVGEISDPIDVQRHYAITKQSDKLLSFMREKELLVGSCKRHVEMEKLFIRNSNKTFPPTSQVASTLVWYDSSRSPTQ